jgi:hypothetical protein
MKEFIFVNKFNFYGFLFLFGTVLNFLLIGFVIKIGIKPTVVLALKKRRIRMKLINTIYSIENCGAFGNI